MKLLSCKKLRAARRLANKWKREERRHTWYVFPWQSGNGYTWDHRRYRCGICEKVKSIDRFKMDRYLEAVAA